MYVTCGVSVQKIYNDVKYDEISDILKDFDDYFFMPEVKVIRQTDIEGCQTNKYSVVVTITDNYCIREKIGEQAEYLLSTLEEDIKESKESVSRRTKNE